MLFRVHTGTFGTCSARTLLGEAYRATPLGGGLCSHPPILNLPRHTAADHHLPKVPLNEGFSDYLHVERTVTSPVLFLSTFRTLHIFLSIYINQG